MMLEGRRKRVRAREPAPLAFQSPGTDWAGCWHPGQWAVGAGRWAVVLVLARRRYSGAYRYGGGGCSTGTKPRPSRRVPGQDKANGTGTQGA